MIHEVIMYGATCDNCGESWYNDHHGWSAMNDESGLKEMISNDEWYTYGDKHYCPSCHNIDDDDNLVLKEVRNDC